jgi:hypothetical protein
LAGISRAAHDGVVAGLSPAGSTSLKKHFLKRTGHAQPMAEHRRMSGDDRFDRETGDRWWSGVGFGGQPVLMPSPYPAAPISEVSTLLQAPGGSGLAVIDRGERTPYQVHLSLSRSPRAPIRAFSSSSALKARRAISNLILARNIPPGSMAWRSRNA